MHAEHGWHVRVSHALRAVPPHFDAGVLTALSVNRGMPGNQNLDSQAVDFNEMMQLFQMLQQKGGPVPAGNPLAHMQQFQYQDSIRDPILGGRNAGQSDLFSPGIQVWRDPRNKEMTVVGVPSKSCAIKEGEIIKCVDGRKVKEWSVQKCLARLSGPANSKVEIVTKKGSKVCLF